jgi:hypothetical protein
MQHKRTSTKAETNVPCAGLLRLARLITRRKYTKDYRVYDARRSVWTLKETAEYTKDHLAGCVLPHLFYLMVQAQKDPRTFVQPSLSFLFFSFLFTAAKGKPSCQLSLSLVQEC